MDHIKKNGKDIGIDMNIRRIFTLIIKEFSSVWLDKKSRVVLILPPLMQLFIFTFALTLEVKNASIGILNKDSGPYSAELVQRIRGSPTFTKILFFYSEKELREAINLQKTLLAVSIDETFSRNLAQGRPAQLQVVVDGRKSNSGQIAQGYISRIVGQYNKELFAQSNASISLPEIETIHWFNPNLIYPWFTLTGLVGILTMITTVSVTAMSIVRERELGTFEQLLITPLTSTEILFGKTIPAICIGIIEGTIMLIAGRLLTGLPFEGSIIAFYLSMFVFVLSIVGIGMFISSISKTQQQAHLGMFFFISPAIILSGYATPIENMPMWLQYITMLNPMKYFLIIVRGICLKDLPWDHVLQNIYPLMLIGVITLSISTYFFKRQLGE